MEKERQESYMNTLAEKFEKIVPENQRHRYHAIFGEKIIQSFDTLEEFLQFKNGCPLACAYYTPDIGELKISPLENEDLGKHYPNISCPEQKLKIIMKKYAE